MDHSMIQANQTLLFIGDSITDTGRDYSNPDDMGRGFAFMASSLYSSLYPGKNIRYYNRGIGGNRIRDVRDRWQTDCLDLKPDWITMLVGVNDAARRYDQQDITTVDEFIGTYRSLMKQASDTCGSRFILLEPFVFPVNDVRRLYREDLDPKIHAIRDLAQETGSVFISLDGMFAEARAQVPDEVWAPDGVHPSPAGHALIACAWLNAVGALKRL
ncbi:SGNH/GDSL hydrolase family protein [Paenibacillus lutrae]|nr:SGNH/GDSL hydrolase family protein [Paenibacillus lutrae]